MTNIHELHDFCATLPGATHDHKWRFEDSVHPVYSVGGRMFAMFSMKAGHLTDSLLFKVDDARFLELTDRDEIEPAAYLAKAKWVSVKDVKRLSDGELRQLLVDAHALILAKASKKMQAVILGTAMPSTPVAKTSKKVVTTTPAKKSATKKAATKKTATRTSSTTAKTAATKPLTSKTGAVTRKAPR